MAEAHNVPYILANVTSRAGAATLSPKPKK